MIRSFLTKSRSRERTLFVAFGVVFVALGLLHVSRQNWSVAALLGGTGIAFVAAGALLSESALRALATLAVLINIAAAGVALFAGVKIQ